MAEWLEAGTKAPDFTLLDDRRQKVKLSQFLGQPIVLYFYPKDDTPGCTKEACAFRDSQKQLATSNVVVLGVSGDTPDSHASFRDKYHLNFPLLADDGFKVSTKYGAYREKNMYGKKSMGIQRSTFIIGADGRIVKVFKRVSVDAHADEVLAVVQEL